MISKQAKITQCQIRINSTEISFLPSSNFEERWFSGGHPPVACLGRAQARNRRVLVPVAWSGAGLVPMSSGQ